MSSKEDALSAVREELLAFMAEMKSWEQQTYSIIRPAMEAGESQPSIELFKQTIKQRLELIFEHHRISGVKNRSRLTSLYSSDPPEYDPETEIILKEEISGGKVFFYTQQTVGLKSEHRYTFSIRLAKWTLIKKEMHRYTGQWETICI